MRQQGPAVVNVINKREPARTARAPQEKPQSPGEGRGQAPEDPLLEFFRRFMPDAPERAPGPGQGLGSGFIISQDGYVLTNSHVVAGDGEVTVRLADAKREFKAKVIGADERTDVALLKIEATGLPTVKLGKSASLQPGEWVAAIGSPFGFENTITAGIVSATGRSLPAETYVPFIQTDVAVNPGNSGGPLINLAGEVVGVNSMIYSQTGGYMGVSFAIPIEVALEVSKQLRAEGKVTRGRLGVRIQPMTKELAQSFKLKEPNGALIASVDPGSPADKAGLRPGDVVLAFNGQAIDDPNKLPRLVAATKPGASATLRIWRDGKSRGGEVHRRRAGRRAAHAQAGAGQGDQAEPPRPRGERAAPRAAPRARHRVRAGDRERRGLAHPAAARRRHRRRRPRELQEPGGLQPPDRASRSRATPSPSWCGAEKRRCTSRSRSAREENSGPDPIVSQTHFPDPSCLGGHPNPEGLITISTRRFCCRPPSVSFEATGNAGP